jgi:hypothetical protein
LQNRLSEILSSFLGQSKDDPTDAGQVQYCCPMCDNGKESFNLEVNIGKYGVYKCWKCSAENNMHGKLSVLIKKFGSPEILSQYKDEVKAIKATKEYEIDFLNGNGIVFDDDEDENKIFLPDNTFRFLFDGNSEEKQALEYLLNRGFTIESIRKYDLKYTTNKCSDWRFNNRIIIPSYNRFNELNFFTGRDYTDRASEKYMNDKEFKRTEVIFNESLLNFDGNIILCEGVLDHTSLPNSSPLLGKSLKKDYYLFDNIVKQSTADIIVFLDSDATVDTEEICKLLSENGLCGRVKYVPTNELLEKINKSKNLGLKKLDPNKLFEIGGIKGIRWALINAKTYECI